MFETHRLPADTGIGRVRLRVADLERAIDFYGGLLGMRASVLGGRAVLGTSSTEEPNDSRSLAAADATPRPRQSLVVLEERPGTAHRPEGTLGLYHFAILLPDRAALGRMLGHLFEARYPFHGFADHGVSEAAYLVDPDGNGIELYADRPRTAWPRTGTRIEMYTKPLDVAGLIRAAGNLPWAGAPAMTCIGHVHLHVAELPRAEQFYAGVLGFDVVTREYPGALFLSAGGYHHHVAVNTWARSPTRPRGTAGLLDFAIHIPDAGARTALRNRLASHATPFTGVPEGIRFEDPEGNGIVVTD
jgi:catechol 2,3-dioxygenase